MRIHFPVPAAENAASFHFEIDAPEGVQILEASLLAGLPGNPNPSFDHVQGSFPTVGLHVIEVPKGSLSRVQIGLPQAHPWWSIFAARRFAGLRADRALHNPVSRDGRWRRRGTELHRFRRRRG